MQNISPEEAKDAKRIIRFRVDLVLLKDQVADLDLAARLVLRDALVNCKLLN